jgi:hypothetical protein
VTFPPFASLSKSPPNAFVAGDIVISAAVAAAAAVSEADVPGRVLLVLTERFVPVGDDGIAPSTFLTLPGRLGEAVTPPLVGSPSLARDATQFLYLVNGKRSFTSSIVINFFSLLLRCGRVGIFSRLIGSTSSPFRIARLRALYLKQYLTPTIIHKFVKTTPKPNATKKSSGEEVGPVPGLLVCVDIVVAAEAVADVGDGIEVASGKGEVDCVPSSPLLCTSLSTTWNTSTMTWLRIAIFAAVQGLSCSCAALGIKEKRWLINLLVAASPRQYRGELEVEIVEDIRLRLSRNNFEFCRRKRSKVDLWVNQVCFATRGCEDGGEKEEVVTRPRKKWEAV